MIKSFEPVSINFQSASYKSDLARAFNWYNQEKEKKDAKHYLRSYVSKDKAKLIDRVPDNKIISTFGWMARMKVNGCVFDSTDTIKLDTYVNKLLSLKPEKEEVEKPVVERPSIRDYLEDKIKEHLGELEGVLDSIIYEGKEFDMYKDLQSRSIPKQYCPAITEWVKRKAGEFISVYETKDGETKAAYAHLGKRGLSTLIKTFSTWLEDIERYSQFKKANRKPRVRKAKPAGVQVSKLNYLKEDQELKLKSIPPTEIIGASQVWLYNVKYKKLSVYRSDSKDGIQVKGSTLQNYDPGQCEHKSIRKPQDVIKKVLEGGKIVLRKLLSEIKSKDLPVNGRVNGDCIILRAVR